MIEGLIGLIVAIIGWSLNRTLTQLDGSLKALNKTVKHLELNMENRPDFEQTKVIAEEASEGAVKDHLIDKHHR